MTQLPKPLLLPSTPRSLPPDPGREATQARLLMTVPLRSGRCTVLRTRALTSFTVTSHWIIRWILWVTPCRREGTCLAPSQEAAKLPDGPKQSDFRAHGRYSTQGFPGSLSLCLAHSSFFFLSPSPPLSLARWATSSRLPS